jgi:hypothetical protein
LAISLVEAQTASRQPVDAGTFHDRVAVAAQVSVEIIDRDEQHIRFRVPVRQTPAAVLRRSTSRVIQQTIAWPSLPSIFNQTADIFRM